MEFKPIDMDRWAHAEYYTFYTRMAPCSFAMTVNVDITAFMRFIREKNLRFYASFIYLISRAVNSMEEYRIGERDGVVGIYDVVSPAYPVFHERDKTFSYVPSEYMPKFTDFYRNILKDMQRYENVRGLSPVASPPNTFFISCIPWASFTHYTSQLEGPLSLAPTIVWGKYTRQDGKVLLPIALQSHHGVADGYHASMFYDRVQALCEQPEQLLE